MTGRNCSALPGLGLEIPDLKRLMTRNGLTEEQAMRRIQSQMPLCEKEKLADRTISTDCPLEELRARMGRLYRQWLEEAQA